MTGVWITAIICLTLLTIVAIGALSAKSAARNITKIMDEELSKWPRH